MRRYSSSLGKISLWQEHLPVKWIVLLYEQLKRLKLVWLEAICGAKEENKAVKKGLSNIFFYRQVLPLLKLFGSEFITTLTLVEFRDIITKVTGANLDKDYVVRFLSFKIGLLKVE
jgi:hypothetical protein